MNIKGIIKERDEDNCEWNETELFLVNMCDTEIKYCNEACLKCV